MSVTIAKLTNNVSNRLISLNWKHWIYPACWSCKINVQFPTVHLVLTKYIILTLPCSRPPMKICSLTKGGTWRMSGWERTPHFLVPIFSSPISLPLTMTLLFLSLSFISFLFLFLTTWLVRRNLYGISFFNLFHVYRTLTATRLVYHNYKHIGWNKTKMTLITDPFNKI